MGYSEKKLAKIVGSLTLYFLLVFTAEPCYKSRMIGHFQSTNFREQKQLFYVNVKVFTRKI